VSARPTNFKDVPPHEGTLVHGLAAVAPCLQHSTAQWPNLRQAKQRERLR
jgi:hypothetical protein